MWPEWMSRPKHSTFKEKKSLNTTCCALLCRPRSSPQIKRVHLGKSGLKNWRSNLRLLLLRVLLHLTLSNEFLMTLGNHMDEQMCQPKASISPATKATFTNHTGRG